MRDVRRPDEIYVGYLPVPPRQKHFLRWLVPTTLWLLCGVCFLWTITQRSPGPAVWDQGLPVKLRGTIIARPYPMLLTLDTEGNPELVLLVEAGKRGGGQRVSSLDGQRATISGWPLKRDGRRMIELEPDEAAVLADADGAGLEPLPVAKSAGRVTLRGEIVDSKCYLGAMKPGEGKTHKECATLCIRGGIPPMLVTINEAGSRSYYLLQSPDGGPVDSAFLPFIADPVELTGDLTFRAGLNVLSVRLAGLRRL